MTKRNAGGNAPPAATPPGVGADQHVEVSSTKHMSADRVAKLEAEIARLNEALEISETQRSAAEAAALAAAEAQGMLLQREIQEVATGKTVTVKRARDPETGKQTFKVVGYKDDGREILRPIFHNFELPTYFYKIDIPPVGGMAIKLGELELYHGAVYELDRDTLSTVKEMVYRMWDHDRNIHGSDENAYRTPQERRLSARAR